VIRDLFPLYLRRPELLPPAWAADVAAAADDTALARIVADYVAGMTDRFALAEHARLCGCGGRRAGRRTGIRLARGLQAGVRRRSRRRGRCQ
jgi:hypothetical protein